MRERVHARQNALERVLPTELLRQLSWLGRITHTHTHRADYVRETDRTRKE